MAEIVWTEPALSDLNEIAEYIELENRGAANRLVQNAFSTVERLGEFPLSGRRPPELAETEYREIIADPMRIFYRVSEDKVFIVHVLRSERDVRAYILASRSKKN